MMMKKICATVATATLLTLPMSAIAQFNFFQAIPNLLSGIGGGGATGADPAAQGGSLVAGFVAANKEVLMANSLMADALGLKDEAAVLQATSDALTDGATQGNLEDASKAITSSTDAVAAAMAKQPKLSAASKQQYSRGIGRLGLGLLRYSKLKGAAANFSSGMSSLNPFALAGLQSGVYVMTQLPSSITNLVTSLQNATAFAKSNAIPVPADATQALAGL
jgi:hypothetical protein